MAVLLMGFHASSAQAQGPHTHDCRAVEPEPERAGLSELERVRQSRARETVAAYDACRFSFLSKDYFARFTRDPAVVPNDGEVLLSANWKIAIPEDAQPLTRIMAEHLAEFLAGRMRIDLAIEPLPRDRLMQSNDGSVVLSDSGGGDVGVEESFTLTVEQQHVVVLGRDVAGLRDGVVKLVDLMGARQGPILPRGERVYRPRVAVRLGVVPWLGSYRDLVFMGHNAVLVNTYFEGEESLFALSTSDAIPELNTLRRPEVLARLIRTAARGTALRRAGILPGEYTTEVSAGRPCPRRTSGNPWGADLEGGRRVHSVHRTPTGATLFEGDCGGVVSICRAGWSAADQWG